MYCVIQKIKNKRNNSYGKPKKLKVDSFTFTFDGETKTKYDYIFTGKFERSIRTAYRISIHKSYRKNGRVKKKQWSICTMSYYDLIYDSLNDYVADKIVNISEETGVSIDDIYNMVNEKLEPIIKAVTKEYETTEEYKVSQKHEEILKAYRESKAKFENKYGEDTYDYCYDVFGVLRNKEYLKKLQADYEAKQKYYSSYYEDSGSNYSDYDYSGYFENKQSNYNDEEKDKLKRIYKVLAIKFHPDMKDGDADMMKFINKLKDQWGI